MTSYSYSILFIENYTIYMSRDAMVTKQFKIFFKDVNRLTLHQDNGKNMSSKETIVV